MQKTALICVFMSKIDYAPASMYAFLIQALFSFWFCSRALTPCLAKQWSVPNGMRMLGRECTSSVRPSPILYSCTPARACLRETSWPSCHTLPSRWGTYGHLKGGASCHCHQSKYFSAPTLTSIKSSQQDHTLLLISSHALRCATVGTLGSDKGAGSDGIMQLSVITPTVSIIEMVLLWRLSFSWLLHILAHCASLPLPKISCCFQSLWKQ